MKDEHAEMPTEVVLQHAEQYCNEQGSKLTSKRRQVLACLLKSKKALSAYELVDHSRDELETTLLPMSVYRILQYLQSIGLVHRLNTAKKYVACAHIACGHAHAKSQFLICKMCDNVQEIGITNSLFDSITRAAEATGFRLLNEQLELECLCNDCSLPESGVQL